MQGPSALFHRNADNRKAKLTHEREKSVRGLELPEPDLLFAVISAAGRHENPLCCSIFSDDGDNPVAVPESSPSLWVASGDDLDAMAGSQQHLELELSNHIWGFFIYVDVQTPYLLHDIAMNAHRVSPTYDVATLSAICNIGFCADDLCPPLIRMRSPEIKRCEHGMKIGYQPRH